MWLKNLVLYRLPKDWTPDPERLEEKFAAACLQPCGALSMESKGWTFPRADGEFLYRQGQHWMLALGVEQKILPASVVRQQTEERVAELAKTQPYPVGRKQKRDIKDQVLTQLMARALSRRRKTFGWIDASRGLLAVD